MQYEFRRSKEHKQQTITSIFFLFNHIEIIFFYFFKSVIRLGTNNNNDFLRFGRRFDVNFRISRVLNALNVGCGLLPSSRPPIVNCTVIAASLSQGYFNSERSVYSYRRGQELK